jgi:hypothetical protein
MADDSDTSQPTTALDHDESNRVSALSALYQAEQSTLGSLDSQVLVLVGLLVTYGIAAVAALGAENAITAAWMYVALPAPVWILLGYNAILWTKVSSHSAAAKVYRTALTGIARSEVHDGVPPRDQWNRLARTVFGLAGSRLLSYGVAFGLIIGFTAAIVWRGRGSPCWFWSGVMVYSFALLIIGTAWLRISYAEAPPNCFKRCMDGILLQRRYRPRHGGRSAAQHNALTASR